MKIKKSEITLKRTCIACPQQYDAFYKDEQVGYLRLRHGCFRVDFPDCGDRIIYEAEPEGDGMFMDDEEQHYLNNAKKAIIKELNKQQ